MIALDFLDGEITYDELSNIDSENFKSDLFVLKEDMLQVEYGNDLLIDAGWYPSFDINGRFQVRVIEDHHWESPLILLAANTITELLSKLRAAQNIVKSRFNIEESK